MKTNLLLYLTILFVFLSFGCGTHKAQTLKQPTDRPPETPRYAVAEESSLPPETLPVDSPAAVPEKNSRMGISQEETDRSAQAEKEAPTLTSSLPQSEELADSEQPAMDENEDSSAAEETDDSGQSLLDAALDLVNSSQEYWAGENQDQAIGALDVAYSLLTKVDTDLNPDLFQQKEDLRYMISKRILEIYASRYTATNGNHNEIPMTLNEYVEKEIKQFQGPEHGSFMRAYQRSGRYMPMILESLKEAGLPEDLAWLPLIESGFKVDALSSARALGLWQFIASTGQKYGLKRDTWIDERLDPEKATAAAIAYLKELHQIFGDWTTVLAGYNCGEGAVLRKIRNQKINYLDNFWDLFQMLPYETARYVPRFLATLHIIKDPAKYGFDLNAPDCPVEYETVTIKKPAKLSDLASAIEVPEEELVALNPELRHKATPATNYALKIPAGKADSLLTHINDIPDWTPPKNFGGAYGTHVVRSGETLSNIAVRYHTTVARIARANNIRTKDIIRVGQKLKVPQRGAAVSSASAEYESELLPNSRYRVKKGDSLWLIARKFNTNTKKIQQINKLKDTRLSVGQILIIPK